AVGEFQKQRAQGRAYSPYKWESRSQFSLAINDAPPVVTQRKLILYCATHIQLPAAIHRLVDETQRGLGPERLDLGRSRLKSRTEQKCERWSSLGRSGGGCSRCATKRLANHSGGKQRCRENFLDTDDVVDDSTQYRRRDVGLRHCVYRYDRRRSVFRRGAKVP